MALPLILLLLLGGALAAAALAPTAPLPAADGRLAAVHRRTRRWRLGGLAAGVAGAWTTVSAGGLGRGLALAVPVAALGVLAGVVIGELRVTAPTDGTRRAALEVRQVRDYLPRRLVGAVAGAVSLLAGVLTWATAVGSADDMGRAGRAFARQCTSNTSEAGGPWPGAYYSLPIAALVVGSLVVAAIALHLVVRRPRQGEDPRVDDALRHQAARVITAAAGLLVTVPLAGVHLFASSAIAGSSCPAWWDRPVSLGLLVSVPLLLALAGWCAASLLTPSRPQHRTAMTSTPR